MTAAPQAIEPAGNLPGRECLRKSAYFTLKMDVAGMGYYILNKTNGDERFMPTLPKTTEGTVPADVTRENVIFVNLLKNAFGMTRMAAVADVLDTSEATLSRMCNGSADIAGLAPAVLKRLFSGKADLAYLAQLTVFELRRKHAEWDKQASQDARDALDDMIGEAEELLGELRTLYNELRPTHDLVKKLRRKRARAAISSLEGHLALYQKDYETAEAAFRNAFTYLDPLVSDLGSRLLLVRAKLNWYYASEMLRSRNRNFPDVSETLTDESFVSVARDIAELTGDHRIPINLAEAHSANNKHLLAAELLHDGARLANVALSELPSFKPVGHDKPLGKIEVFETALLLVPEIAGKRTVVTAKPKSRQTASPASSSRQTTLPLT